MMKAVHTHMRDAFGELELGVRDEKRARVGGVGGPGAPMLPPPPPPTPAPASTHDNGGDIVGDAAETNDPTPPVGNHDAPQHTGGDHHSGGTGGSGGDGNPTPTPHSSPTPHHDPTPPDRQNGGHDPAPHGDHTTPAAGSQHVPLPDPMQIPGGSKVTPEMMQRARAHLGNNPTAAQLQAYVGTLPPDQQAAISSMFPQLSAHAPAHAPAPAPGGHKTEPTGTTPQPHHTPEPQQQHHEPEQHHEPAGGSTPTPAPARYVPNTPLSKDQLQTLRVIQSRYESQFSDRDVNLLRRVISNGSASPEDAAGIARLIREHAK